MDFSWLIPLSIVFGVRCLPAHRETRISVSLYPTIHISTPVLSRHLIRPGSCEVVFFFFYQNKPGQSVMHTLLSDIKCRHRVADMATGLRQPVRHQLIYISIVMLSPIYTYISI